MSRVVINNSSGSFCTEMHISNVFLILKCGGKKGSIYTDCIFLKIDLKGIYWINTVVRYKCKSGKLFKFTFKYFSCPSLLKSFHSFPCDHVG